MTNRPLPELGGSVTPEGVIHIERARFLWEERLYERLCLTNYGERKVPVPLHFEFGADFADIFEVRGHRRSVRGRLFKAEIIDGRIVKLAYEGLDGVLRASIIALSSRPDQLSDNFANVTVVIDPHDRYKLYLEIGPTLEDPPSPKRFRHAAARARVAMRRKRRRGASVSCARGPFRAWLEKSRADLALLVADLPTGPYPYAGIPWFSTAFGRDGIITALQLLWLDPSLARGVLQFHATHQANTTSAFEDAAPGKVLHEMRNGEMSAVGEVPFKRYYGGVDTTPLFVWLAGAYARRTGDMPFIETLWPALVAAMEWIDGPGDSNNDGFLDYARARKTGLVNQGWKDSSDCVFHADGTMAEAPIALVEVQGYVYAARQAMAWLAERRGERKLAQHWRTRARELRTAIEKRFWLPELGFYAIALDGEGRPCRVRTSNAGQLLFTGVPSASRAARVIDQLLSAAFDDGWGIRTLAQSEPRFNPMSYHNGSIWPHDTAVCAAGIAAYGSRAAAAQLASELFAAAVHFGNRLPELFCGFARKPGEPPVGYPVACLPQAWSSGAIFMVLQACLGITVDSTSRRMHIDRPTLPAELERLTVRSLSVDRARVDIVFERAGDRVVAAPLGPIPESVEILVRT